MKIKNYEESVLRTAKSCETKEMDGQTLNILHWSLGLSGEVGELVDTIKKHVFYGQPFDMVNAKEELGDIQYYVTMMCRELGLSLEEVMEANKKKLDVRYPEGYSDVDAKVRADKQQELELGDPCDWVWVNEGDKP
jgi:NTP pyrophosphatase (non-canonical NTP hydrolase)